VVWLVLAPAAFAQQAVSITYTFEEPRLTTEGGITTINIPGCRNHQRVGEPTVPFKTARILLPSGSRIAKTSVTFPSSSRILPGHWQLGLGRIPRHIPFPGQVMTAFPEPEPAVIPADPFPQKPVKLMAVQRMEDRDIAVLHLFPIQYHSTNSLITYYPAIHVQLELETGGLNSRGTPSERIKNFVDNPPESPPVQRSFSAMGASATAETFDYLLVTKAFLMPAFQPLIDQKTAAGLAVKTETIETILSTQSGIDSAEKLRNYIRDAYTTWGIRYVLLGGDAWTVPYRGVYGYSSGETVSYMPSDLYFSCLDGSWNSNGNSLWGEPDDGVGGGEIDLVGEVYVGRAPVDTIAETDRFVGKIVEHETTGLDVLPRTQMVAEFLGQFPPDIYAQGGNGLDPLLSGISNSYIQADWLDDRPQNQMVWGKNEVLARLNRSPQIVAHNGHADETYMMRLGKSDITSLSNATPFLLNSVGCDCGAFDGLSDCIGEEFVKKETGGAYAVIMNSRLGWYDPADEAVYSGEFQQAFFDLLLDQAVVHIGEALLRSKHQLLGMVEQSGNMPYRWCYLGLNLLGDPHTRVKLPAEAPPTLTLRRPSPDQFCVEWNSKSNTVYDLQYSFDLTSGSFTSLSNGISATVPANIYTDTVHNASAVFYRLQAQPLQ